MTELQKEPEDRAWGELHTHVSAFEDLVAHYQKRIFALAYKFMGNREDSEDILQEVYLKVYRNLYTLKDPLVLSTWIMQITKNTCIKELIRKQRHPTGVPLIWLASDLEDAEEADFVDKNARTPEELVLNDELQACVSKILVGLPQAARKILIMRDIDYCPYEEIAASLGIGLSAAKMRVKRSRQAFKRQFEKECI